MTALQFIAALLLIVASSEFFTNAIEWAGYRLKMGSGATGSLLAAFGTALPETIVPIVALASGAPSATQVATGAVLGAPLLLLTLGVAITGVAVLLRRDERHLVVSRGQVRRDLGTFVAGFSLVITAMFLPARVHVIVGGILLAMYAAYVVVTLRSSDEKGSMPEPLHLMRWREGVDSHDVAIVLQLLLAVGGLIAGSNLFVTALDTTASAFHLSPLILAVVLVPFATELPETLNSVLWVRSRDDSLAFGNVVGSATFQACVLGFLGVTFTPWSPGNAGYLSAGLTLFTGVVLLLVMWRGRASGRWLVLAALPWIVYVVCALLAGGRLAPTG